MGSIPQRLPVQQVSLRPTEDEQLSTHLAGNEFEIPGALSITVTCSVRGSSLVGRVLGKTTIGVHLDEVQGAVDTTTWRMSQLANAQSSSTYRILTKTRDVNVEGELLVLQLEQFVLVTVDQVDSRANVVTLLELQADRVAAGLDTVGTRVVCKMKISTCRPGLESVDQLPAPSRAQLAAHCTLLGQSVASKVLPV